MKDYSSEERSRYNYLINKGLYFVDYDGQVQKFKTENYDEARTAAKRVCLTDKICQPILFIGGAATHVFFLLSFTGNLFFFFLSVICFFTVLINAAVACYFIRRSMEPISKGYEMYSKKLKEMGFIPKPEFYKSNPKPQDESHIVPSWEQKRVDRFVSGFIKDSEGGFEEFDWEEERVLKLGKSKDQKAEDSACDEPVEENSFFLKDGKEETDSASKTMADRMPANTEKAHKERLQIQIESAHRVINDASDKGYSNVHYSTDTQFADEIKRNLERNGFKVELEEFITMAILEISW